MVNHLDTLKLGKGEGVAARRSGTVTAAVLRHFRTYLGLRQTELADRLGMKTTSIVSWEGGRRRIPDIQLKRLAELAQPDEVPVWDAAFQNAALADGLIQRVAFDQQTLASEGGLIGHPLASRLLLRQQSAMVDWALHQRVPPHLPGVGVGVESPRQPFVAADLKRLFFEHLRAATERASKLSDHELTTGDDVRLVNLRVQGYYHSAFDYDDGTLSWLQAQRSLELARLQGGQRSPIWTPRWMAFRAATVALSKSNYYDAVDEYLTLGSRERFRLADLEYWALYAGEPQGSITRIYGDPRNGGWDGRTLLSELSQKLSALRVPLEGNLNFSEISLTVETIIALISTRAGVHLFRQNRGDLENISAATEEFLDERHLAPNRLHGQLVRLRRALIELRERA